MWIRFEDWTRTKKKQKHHWLFCVGVQTAHLLNRTSPEPRNIYFHLFIFDYREESGINLKINRPPITTTV